MAKSAKLTDMVSMRTLEKLQDNFSEATNISCVIRDTEGEAITKFSNISKLWQEVHNHPEVEKEANEKFRKILEKCQKNGQIEIYQRYFDTYAFVVPIHIEGQIVAFFIGGLTRFGNPNIERCTQEAKRLNIDIDKFLELYLSLPLVTEERLMACANLLKVIASTIGTLTKQGTEAKEKAEEMEELNDYLEKEIEKSEQELFEREEKYRMLFNTINDGVYMADTKGVIKEINKTGAELLGYKREELLGMNVKSLYVNPDSRDDFLKKLYEKGHLEHFHSHIRLKNGKAKYFDTNSTTMVDKSGKIIGVQGIFRDPEFPENVKAKENNSSRLHAGISKDIPKIDTTHDAEKTSEHNAQNNQEPSQQA